MKNISKAFRDELNNDNRNFVKSCTITLADGTVLNITQSDTWQNGFSIDEAVSSEESFDLGSAIIDEFDLTLNNIYDKFSAYDFTDAVITNVRIGLVLPNGTTEHVKRGVFTVNDARYNGSTISLECFDNMSKFDKDYSLSNLSYPTTLLNIVKDACSCCNVSMASDIASFPNSGFTVNTRPVEDGLTFRKVLAWTAQISGIWFKCNDSGQLSSKMINMETADKISNSIDGGTFSPWTAGDSLDGGTFNPWTTGDVVDGGAFADMGKYHHIFSLINPDIATDDVVITGIQVKEQLNEEVKTYLSGSTGYVLSIENNDLIQDGKGQEVASYLSQKFVGLKFRPLSVSCLTDPSIEAGDFAFVTDRHGRSYFTIITRNTLTPGNFQQIACNAETPKKKSVSRYSEITKIYQEFRKTIQKQKTEFDKALDNLSQKLNESAGLHTTIETTSSGGKIFYLHDKPSLEESEAVWKMTAEAWGVSTDGGDSWNGGMTVDGDTITRILTAVGVNAEWITAGAFVVKDNAGNILFSADKDTNKVYINGNTVVIGGKPATQAISDAVTEAKTYSDGKLADYADVVTKDVSNLQAQIDGQIETYYYDYEPTLLNYPASEWTTTEERTKHIGDIFYWKSRGYSYRFFQDGSTWKWQLVQDTDITQAMAAAEKAQDTADGKRRVFVVQPEPPYDIGDLWSQDGGDLLTCTVSRASGNYVSSDWKKYNKYTDDTKAEEALIAANNARALSIIMTNEYQGVPTDADGNYTTLPIVTTTIMAYFGHSDVSGSCVYTYTESDGITGSWDANTRTYTVTRLAADTAYVDITATYLGGIFKTTKRFTVAKVKAGQKGEKGDKGDAGRTYFLQTSALVMKIGANKVISPSNVTFSSYYRDGQSATKINYAGRFIIEETVDGSTWIKKYTSSVNESSKVYTPSSADIVAIRCTMYEAGGTTKSLDSQTVTLLIDIDNLTHEEVFNLMTDNGKYTVFFKQDDLLLINANYIGAGKVKGEYIEGKNLTVTNTDGDTTLAIDKDGNVSLDVTSFALKGKSLEDVSYEANNLLRSPISLLSADWGTSATKTFGAEDPNGGNNATSLYATTAATFYNRGDNKPIKTAGSYSFTVWLKAVSDMNMTVRFNGKKTTVALTTEWSQYQFVYVGDTVYDSSQVHFTPGTAGVTWYIYNPTVQRAYSQEEIFNILTDNGATQGIYMKDGKLYVNATYIDTGNLAGWTIDKTNKKLTSPNGTIVIDAKNEKIIINGVEMKAYGNGLVISNGLTVECGTDEFSDGTDGFNIKNLSTSTSGSYLRVNSSGYVSKDSSSSERYKDIERVLTGEDVEDLYGIEVYSAKYKDGYLDKRDERCGQYMPMFTVENMEKYLPIAVNHNEDGSPEMWNSQIMIPVMFQMLKEQKKRINQLESILGIKEVTS